MHAQALMYEICTGWPVVAEPHGTKVHQGTLSIRKEGRGFPTLFLFPEELPGSVAHRPVYYLCRDPCQNPNCKAVPAVQGDCLGNAGIPCYFLSPASSCRLQ